MSQPEPATPPAARPAWSERAGLWIFIAFVVVHGAIMAGHVSNIAGGADPSCYLELSRLFLEGDLSPELRPVAGLPLETFPPALYAPISYTVRDYSGLIPTGFPGFPLLLAFLDLFLPTPWAVGAGVWLTMMGCGVLVFLLVRALGLGTAWACFAGVTMGISPLTVLIGSVPMTDPMTCCLAALAWILALQAPRGRGWGLALGFTLGLAVLTRATNVLLFLPVTAILLLRDPRRTPWVAIGLGGLPAAVFFFGFNLAVHGSPFIPSGYADIGELMHASQVGASLRHDLKWMHLLFFPAAIAPAPLSLLWLRRRPALVAGCWLFVAAYVGFYAFYYASSESWFILRYIMPAIVAVIVAAVFVLSRLEAALATRATWRSRAAVLPLVLTAASLGWGAWQSEKLGAYHFKYNEGNIPEVLAWLETATQPEDVFLCFHFSGSLHYYTDRAFLRREQLTPEQWQRLRAATAEGPDIYAICYSFEPSTPEALAQALPGRWVEVFVSRDPKIHVFRLERERP